MRQGDEVEIRTADEVQAFGCRRTGCSAGPGIMKFERVVQNSTMIAHICPYGHRRYYIIKIPKQSHYNPRDHRNDSWKTGRCADPRCKNRWRSKSVSRKYCDSCQADRRQKTKDRYNERCKQKMFEDVQRAVKNELQKL